jgi:penicillin-binding protein 1C
MPSLARNVLRLSLGLACALACTVLALRLAPKPSLREQLGGTSQAFYSSDGTLLRMTTAPDQQYRLWTPLAQVSPRLQEAVQLYEDRWYAWHPGVNPLSLARGAWTTWRGTVRRGGSTITMQLARRLYRIDSRTPVGKLQQAAAALWLSARYGKDEVLEAYLNAVPYGGNVEGAGAASLVYLGKRAADLSLPEALALAVIPQNPNRRGGAAGDAAWQPALAQARQRLWQAWLARHPDDGAPAVAAELALPLQLRSARQLPFAAPHAVQAVLADRSLQVPASATTVLSLHGPTQAALERAIAQHVQRLKPQGIRNAAALLVDAPTMQVKGWVGSADFFDAAIAGQVNATAAKRSPGSTLKPFIYALALDQGLLHPRTVLKDAPAAFGTYSPENFDGRFEGPVTAQDALVRSRNIPAVSVSARLGSPGLHGFLKLAGVSGLRSEAHYGLALTLGGGEVTMEELAVLYALLANDGELRPLQAVLPHADGGARPQAGGVAGAALVAQPAAASPAAPPVRLLSEEAAFITRDMLAANPRPDTGRPAFPRVAWKTGTSWGFRDAWVAGVFGRSVLVVWLGNFDGTHNPALVGVQVAAPLFFAIVDSLRQQGLDPGEPARGQPPQLARVQVCAASGDLPNAHCPQLAPTWFIAGRSPIRLSRLHRAVPIDIASGRAVCRAGPGTRTEVFEFWGSDMRQLFAAAGMPRRAPPALPRCDGEGPLPPAAGAALAGTPGAEGPQIVTPLRGAAYVLRAGHPAPLGLRANAASAGPLYWFADNAYLGSAAAGAELPWSPGAAGRYTLSAVDAQGQSDQRDVVVEFAP